MKKKLLSLVLLAGLILSTLTGCGASAKEEEDTTIEPAHMTTTITLTAITGESTTPEAIEKVQAAFNKLTKSEYKTQVIFQLKTEEEYLKYVEEQAKLIEERIKAEEEAEKKAKEEAKKKKEEEKLANANKKKKPGKWNTTTKAETEDTAEETQEMTVDEFGRPVAKYPDLEGPSLDILFI
ncbi:MAG: hypothetical protein J6S76_05065, partial [Clostridia bacterium]|nr:hypothetical protein [Clostridia bacterium]